MNKTLFWRGYLLGIVLALGLGTGTLYYLFLYTPDVGLAGMNLVELDGRPVDARQFAGRRVLVNYWATWCGPCIEEFPVFETVKQEAGQGVVFLMVSDEPAAKIQGFLRKHPQLSFRFLRVREPLPGVNVRPMNYGYDQSGALVVKRSGSISAADLRQLVASL